MKPRSSYLYPGDLVDHQIPKAKHDIYIASFTLQIVSRCFTETQGLTSNKQEAKRNLEQNSYRLK